MNLICISQGESFLKYPDGSVTIGKKYKVFTDFEVPNTLFFNGDDGKVWKIIPGYFRKVTRKKYQVLSPDGFTIDFVKYYYPSRKQAIEAFEKWKKRFEIQGYYSSSNHGRIPLDELENYCSFSEI